MPSFKRHNALMNQNDTLKRNIAELRFKLSMEERKLTTEGVKKLAQDIEAMKFNQDGEGKEGTSWMKEPLAFQKANTAESVDEGEAQAKLIVESFKRVSV